MRFQQEAALLFVPDGLDTEPALSRTTHLAIGAHQDDLEIMAIDGILKCFQRQDRWFTGVIVTDGAGSPRANLYASYTDDQMRIVRVKEQMKAAIVGEYAAQAMLAYPSSEIKDPSSKGPIRDLLQLLRAAQPEVVYTHNLADKHDTHVAVALRVIEALRRLPEDQKPQHVYGCETWRDLDWLLDEEKIVLDASGQENLQAALLGVFDSQIAGGKRYDLATLGRRRANATYYASHATDEATELIFAMDLTPLAHDPQLDIAGFVQGYVNRFAADVHQRIERFLG